MKKSLLAITFVAFPLSAKTTRLRTYGCVAIVLLAGCTATQTRWDATNIRKEVMVYYNDQIMDNLISAKNHLPFVHVDITLLTSQGASQITGTIGAGETRTNTNASKSMSTAGILGTITNAVTRPFAWSVSPQQTETLSIQAAPALGSQTIASMSLPMTKTKETDEIDPNTNKPTKVTNEKTPTPVTIYKLYENFADNHLSNDPVRPEAGTFVPGTVKKYERQYYYVHNKDRCAYYKFCKKLFIKGQSQTGSLERALQQTQAAAALH